MLRTELRAAIFRARQTAKKVKAAKIPVSIQHVIHSVDIHVHPAQELAPDYMLVVSEEHPDAPSGTAAVRSEEQSLVRHLEEEIEQLKFQQRAIVEEYEASVEELKSSNEELQAINEELRSATEELETSREELQSINEE